MSTVTIGGKTYRGNSIVVTGSNVIIDGKKVEDGLTGIVELKIEGNIDRLETDCPVSVKGNVGSLKAGGSVNCGDVAGGVYAGGSVNCGNVGGDVSAGGSVNHR